ncbi:SusC/RagA family TonB-linked outer membrane protein [Bacteroides thetaiotaomicron]|uniref:SusC/RagA family TonB-linked outer membrane protein n=1 Tax=Bacteroides thetaiotaomicron TaxID=818 RepID=UPI00203046AF|nr:TonB-dependent receptor [Bacteroides thetaiotaomicron]MCM1657241.1 TonB-dependent receptor [Bacteroides thetaiotaomicron]MCM1661879.1 TonB-dependent receptor [Bacteroides thetaiotaomicron]MCM1698413.1 TonB-dependent receptor [Bacteroides thetaiotaomicron]MCM1712063.1 TonB-dependent receptor [Bacteroides thetaiotaomicron]MCM1794133.1 TonB-dependent receptor [Bacteroides thetaiotaomicron]
MKKLLSVLFLLSFTLAAVYAQNIQIKGTVVSGTDNEPLPGVNVVVKGNTSTGTITDFNGTFTLSAPADAILSISYIGFKSQEIAVKGHKDIKIVLQEDSETLDEVVVVGYGVQKKSVVTASIAKVSADDLASTAPVRMDNALKGLASGVTVTSSSGQPGAAAQIRVRGVGTIRTENGAADPLYIVDGMPLEGGLDYLNPNDIASIEVLKDAASGAVYGARAANGVILVTTKTGKIGKTKVTYDFSYGWQSAWKKRDVLNASEYALMINEGAINAGIAPKFSDPYSYGQGTNWQDEVFNNNAPMMNHQVSVSGASEKVNYLFSLGFYTQDGIVGGNFDRSNYERLTLRSNTQYTLFDESKERNWLNSLKVTSNLSYARIKSTNFDDNSTWGTPLGSALALSPILNVYDETEEAIKAQFDKYGTTAEYTPVYDPRNGKLFSIPGEFGEMSNPIAKLSLPGDKHWSHKFVANFSAELQLWDNLKFKTSYGADLSFWGYDSYRPLYYLRSGESSTQSSAYSRKEDGTVWQLENVLMYDKSIDKHSFSVLLGQSAKKSSGSYLYGSRNNITNYSRPYIDASTGLAANADRDAAGAPSVDATLASIFARASYNYDERYMLQVTVRRDGSSRFGPNNHYAVFPSFSLGWNLTNEKFMNKRPNWLTTTKIRLSWGKNGNENIGNFKYTVLTSPGNNAIFGSSENVINGMKASGLANPDLKWEESEQLDFGLDFGFFNNALTFTADYYKKKTNGMLMEMNIPFYVGEAKPIGNVGKMENSGIELEAAYKFRVSDWNFRVSANASYLKNKLIEYGNESGWENLDSFQGTGDISRAENGKPFPFFYGYKTAGIFQNTDEVKAYKNDKGELLQPTAVPGDVRFVDVDGNGIIDANDRTDIGKGMPDWTFGFNLGVSWKNFDLNMMWQGTAGNDIYDATRRTDIATSNLPSWMLNRWTGEGTSNRIPRFVQGDNVNWQSSDLYVYDGSYLRLKNIQLGYTLPAALTQKVFISSLRFYVAAENLFTFTKYHGFDPEISSGGTSLGIDYGVYPQARVWTIGASLSF